MGICYSDEKNGMEERNIKLGNILDEKERAKNIKTRINIEHNLYKRKWILKIKNKLESPLTMREIKRKKFRRYNKLTIFQNDFPLLEYTNDSEKHSKEHASIFIHLNPKMKYNILKFIIKNMKKYTPENTFLKLKPVKGLFGIHAYTIYLKW